jgi:predicted hotdog family 3-hydroxylacyl-ACP dehydratase
MSGFKDIPVQELLPQRPPFLFVDHLLHYDQQKVVSSFTVPADGYMTENGRLTASGLIENVAQTSALRIGYIAVYVKHIPVQIGYIGQVRGLEIYRLPLAGEALETHLTVVQDIFGITLANAEVRSGGEVLAVMSLKTAVGEE